MRNSILTATSTFRVLYGWSKALAPYVANTITGKRYLTNRKTRKSTSLVGVDEYFPLVINGHPQWLRIRGMNETNPIILYLHGGPGGSQIPSYRHYQLEWEQDFTIVHWEQRGAGKSFTVGLDFASMTIAQLVEDALEVISYLSERFSRRDIVLLGHSWGSFLGIHVLQTHPKNVSAYVGVGQVSNQVETEREMYKFALKQASASNNQTALQQLTLGDYPSPKRGLHVEIGIVRKWASFFGYLGSSSSDATRNRERLMGTPEYGLHDIYKYLKGTLVSSETLGRRFMTDESIQPTSLPLKLEVPIFLISGRRDHFTPTQPADNYLSSIEAPDKKHVIFENCGHYPNEDEPGRFINELVALVGPYLQHNRD